MSHPKMQTVSRSSFKTKRIGIQIILGVLITLGVHTACVTVNVNFPESAVQKATDDYVRDLYRSKEKKSEPEAAPSPSASLYKSIHWVSPWNQTAIADDEVFKVDTDKALTIRDKLAGRLADVIQFKRSGVLGESNDGMLVLKDGKKLKPILLKKVEKIVSDENKDREELYNEIVSANGMNKNRVKNVQKSFARSFQAESPSQSWVQDTEGKWAQKP